MARTEFSGLHTPSYCRLQRMLRYGVCLILSLGLLFACGGLEINEYGKIVSACKSFRLKDAGPHGAVWETSDVVLNFTYTKKGQQLRITGELGLNHISNLDHFYLWIHLLDAEGKILQSEQYLNLIHEDASWETVNVLELAPAAVAIAFSYNGSYRKSSGDGSTVIDFSHYPC